MPSYDLQCTSCAHDFEVFRQGFLRDEDRSCPQCGAHAEQMITAGFVAAKPLRGGGSAAASGGGSGHAHGGGCGCGHNH